MGSIICPNCHSENDQQATVCRFCGSIIFHPELPMGYVLTHGKDSYSIGNVLGAGGFGITYMALDETTKKKVAIKEFFPQQLQPTRHDDCTITIIPNYKNTFENGKKSFISEATMVMAFSDLEHIVKVYKFFEKNNTAYIVMEFVEGRSLKEIMSGNHRFNINELMDSFLPLLKDIGVMHEAGVIHRDIAPDNIIKQTNGSFKLIDFGCARAMENGKSMTVQVKPGFSPIEQLNTHGQGKPTDIYAICATLYYCLSGKLPVRSTERSHVIKIDHNPDPLISIFHLVPNIPEQIGTAIMWGLSLTSENRPQTIEEFLEAAGYGISPPPPPPPPPPQPGGNEKVDPPKTDVKVITQSRSGGNQEELPVKKFSTGYTVMFSILFLLLAIGIMWMLFAV